MMKLRLLALLCSVLFLGATTSPPLGQNPRIQEMYSASCRFRAQAGMPTQVLDEELCKIAQRWANTMAAQNSMYHGGGEQVIGRGYANGTACVQGWINSPGHRAFVMGGSTRVGFGCQRAANGQWFYAGVYR
ncbi:CAP domain-containing protein [Planctomicrobium sp. SH664]|uniref:CAP domain-containing protein n=1 Tax=Planctomicrobium sp. SH664 TaxID=3448125 RepID=UPI003F5B3D8E